MNNEDGAGSRQWLIIGGALLAVCVAAVAIIITVRSTQVPVASAKPVPQTATAPGGMPGGAQGNAAYYSKRYGGGAAPGAR